jgi:polysaccharide export outer membrane protein
VAAKLPPIQQAHGAAKPAAAVPQEPAASPLPVEPAAPIQPATRQVPAAPSRLLPEVQDDVYILGAGDGLTLRFLGASELSGPVEVLNDGTASLPLLGPVRLSGLTLAQATLWLESLYKKQLLRPELQISLTRPRPLRISVVGQVERPGLYTLTTSEQSTTEATVSISGLPTLVDAIQKAGGITPFADLRNVILQRRLPGEEARFKRARVNLMDLILAGDQTQNPLLFDGDTIRLEIATEPVLETMELSETTLAPTSISVNVVGEVVSPGTRTLPSATPLIQAIMAAGGAQNWRANRTNVELVRINRNGTATRRSYPLNLSQGASNRFNPPLRNGDTVIVNRSGLAQVSDALNAVGQPLTGLVNILSLYEIIRDNNNNN